MHLDSTARTLAYSYPDPLAQPTLLTAAGEAAPASPACPGRPLRLRCPGHCHWPLTAIVLLVVIQTELLTVVRAADQVSFTASVAVTLTSITRAVTVTLSLVTRLL